MSKRNTGSLRDFILKVEHLPRQARDKCIGTAQQKESLVVVAGRMIRRLEAAKMLENTIWLLTTDNGAPVPRHSEKQ